MNYKEGAERFSLATNKLLANTKTAAKNTIKNVIHPTFNKATVFLQHSPRILAALISIVILFSCTVTVALATDATSAYSVMYNGKSLGYVKDPTILAEAEILAAGKLNNYLCNYYIIEGDLVNTIASQDELITSAELADILIENSDNIVCKTVLEINGTPVATGENIEEIIADYLSNYKIENKLQEVELCDGIEAKKVYTLKSITDDLPSIETYLESGNTLSVKSVETITVVEPIAFKTEQTKSNKYAVGTRIVTQEGVKGATEVTYKIAKLNGVVTEKIKISSETITEPTPKKVTIGTKRVIAADKNGSAPMCWPVKRVEGVMVTSYMGDSRGHKGMDIAAPKGTPIYSGASGEVTFSGWDNSGYGYKIVVKHKNGYETLYAHCSAIYVKKGQKVAKGEMIGAVGTTGRSTGNHLHFEVRKNDVCLNPVNFIGSN